MVSLIKIDFEELKNFVRIAYEGDEDLLIKFHIDHYTLEQAINSTMEMIERTNNEVGMDYFGVVINGERVGYLCTFENNLYSFGINIMYRNEEILSQFWDNIKKVLGESFICMLYPNNTRAINWLQKCKMKIVPDVEDNCVTLLYHNKIKMPCLG